MRPPTRRLVALAATAVILATAGIFAGRRGALSRRPHLVVFVWDTCRADRVSALGYGRRTTPGLELLAARGVRFTHCYSPSPWTPPAHASLFTGLLPSRHGLRDQRGDKTEDDIPHLAETLSRAGYETVAISSNSNVSDVNGLDRGFETFERAFALTREKANGGDALTLLDHWLSARDQHSTRPVFLFVNLIEPHLPLQPAPEDLDALPLTESERARAESARILEEGAAIAHVLRVRSIPDATLGGMSDLYDGAVHQVDRATTAMMDRLRTAGLLDNAVVVVTADHGENLGEHGDVEHRFSVKDTVLHVPLVIHWPGRLEGGRTETAQVRLQDVYATLLEAAEAPTPARAGKDATTLLATPLVSRTVVSMFGPASDYLPEARLSFPSATPDHLLKFRIAWQTVREDNRWKYERQVLHPETGKPSPWKELLYRVDEDPGESNNLLGPDATPEAREVAKRLGALLEPAKKPERKPKKR